VSRTAFPRLAADGIFGHLTLNRVKEFQKQNHLKVDGIVGPHTWGVLLATKPGAVPAHLKRICSTGDPGNKGPAMLTQMEYFALPSPGEFDSTDSSLAFGTESAAGSSPIRMLSPAQVVIAKSVYGESLDVSRIYISNKSGLGGLAFTVAFPDSNEVVQIMNCGTFTPSTHLLIHELAHVWQSQHHSDPYRFMVNAVDCQVGAAVSNGNAAIDDPGVILHHEFPRNFPFSAYAYMPGFGIDMYGAEQMARAVEKGDKIVRAQMRSKVRNSVDSRNITALSRPSFADRRMTGVIP